MRWEGRWDIACIAWVARHSCAWQALGTWHCLPTHILRWLSSLLLCSDCRHGLCRDGGRHLWHGKPSRQLVMLMTLHRRVPPPCQRLLSLRHALLSPCDCRTCTPTRSPTGGSALPTSHACMKEPWPSVPAGAVPRSSSPPYPASHCPCLPRSYLVGAIVLMAFAGFGLVAGIVAWIRHRQAEAEAGCHGMLARVRHG